MGWRKRALKIVSILKDGERQSLREISSNSTIPKSSVHRHCVSLQKRVSSVGHSFFETEEGAAWLHRLFFAVIFVFGIQCNIGAETLSLFFGIITLTHYVSSSTSALRTAKNAVRKVINEYDDEQMKVVMEACKNKELHLGGDETFFDNTTFLVMMELTSGFILTEAKADDRTFKTWCDKTKAVTSKLKHVLSFTSDKGAAIWKFAKNITANPIIDLFHMMQDIHKVFASQFSAKRRALVKAKKMIECKNSSSKKESLQSTEEASSLLIKLDQDEKQYKNAIFKISTHCHPYQGVANKQNTSMLEGVLIDTVGELRHLLSECNLTDKQSLLDRCARRAKPLSELNDLWHKWVNTSVVCKTTDRDRQQWAVDYLLPWSYWEMQAAKSKRKQHLREHYQEKAIESLKRLKAHPLTSTCLNDDWCDWANAMSLKYQRTSSAVEGRNARLSHHYFSAKGLRDHQVKPLTTIHNFWIKRPDNRTACERLCKVKPPDLFEFILKRVGDIPVPRKSRQQELAKAA